MNIAIFRTDHNPLNFDQYNCQELGLSKALTDSGHEVTIVLVRNKKSESRYPDSINHGRNKIRILQLDYQLIPLLEYPLLFEIKSILKRINPDICHINEESCPATLQVAWYARRLEIKVVCYHGMYSTPTGFARRIYEKLHNILFRPYLQRIIQHCFAKTTFAEDYLKSRGYDNVTVLPVGLDTTKFEKSTAENTGISFPADKFIVLYVGVFEKRRNIRFLLELAKGALGLNLHFVFIGKGPEEQYAQNYMKCNNLTNVTLPGALQQSELVSYYKEASVFVLASDYEIFGMVLLEAMYFGLPIVSNLNAGSVDLISDENGTILHELRPEIWLESISRWTINNDKNRAVAIKKKFEDNFTWEKISDNYLDKIRSLS